MHYIEDHKMLPWMFAGLTDWLTYLTGWLTNLEVHTHIQYCIKTVSGLMGGGVGGLGHSAFLRDGYNMAVLGNVKVRLALFPVGENPPVGKMLPFPGAILRLRTGKFPHMSPYPPAIRTLFGDSKKNSEEEKNKLLMLWGAIFFNMLSVYPLPVVELWPSLENLVLCFTGVCFLLCWGYETRVASGHICYHFCPKQRPREMRNSACTSLQKIKKN